MTVESTKSICPTCKKTLDASRKRRGRKVYIEKKCDTCGEFSSVIWNGEVDFDLWRGGQSSCFASTAPSVTDGIDKSEIKKDSCCILLEVTKRCNLNCPFCFAEGESGGVDRLLEEVIADINSIAKTNCALLQISGGEPTVRDDLPLIIKAAKDSGIDYIQLNTNGIVLAEEGYAATLKEAGLSFVFLQFDGVTDGVYKELRGKELLEIKKAAIKNCGDAGLGVVLVPMLVPSVNVKEIGAILRFAINRSPSVRGVHFQPVSYFGRVGSVPNDKKRFTLDMLIAEIYEQSYGLVEEGTLLPSTCDHPLCGLHGDFLVREDFTLFPLHKFDEGKERSEASPEANCNFVARRWLRRDEEVVEVAKGVGCDGCQEDCESCDYSVEGSCAHGHDDMHEHGHEHENGGDCSSCGGGDCSSCSGQSGAMSLDEFISRVKSHGFTITAMAFQDQYNMDIERLEKCSLHVYENGRLLPFCGHYSGVYGD